MDAEKQSTAPASHPSNSETAALKNLNSKIELSFSSKEQKTNEGNIDQSSVQETFSKENNALYCDFSTTNKKSSDSKSPNPIEQLLQQATTSVDDQDSDEDEEKKKLNAAKKLLFPSALATSYPEVVDTLRNERRQEFCPIYKDETPEAIAERQAGRKPIGSLLAKRIRWDDLKRKQEVDQRRTQIPIRYGPYGPIYPDSQPSFSKTYRQNSGNVQNQSQPSFANPYEQYYTAVQHQYEQMAQMNRAQQEYSGFWPTYSQQSFIQNNHQQTQYPIEQPIQPYTYAYPSMHFNSTTNTYPNIPTSHTSTDDYSHLRQPPPPPPSEPYPY